MVYRLEEIKRKIIPIAERYHLSKVYLFGSYVRGQADDDSDVDIALETESGLSFFDAYGELLKEFDDKVDVLLVSDLLSPQTNIGKLVKRNFSNERELIYERTNV